LEAIKAGLAELGLGGGDILMVHSDVRRLGRARELVKLPNCGADLVIDALIQTVGPEGTLLMPALSYENVGEANPVFDVRNTRSCVGLIPEVFRKRLGTIRSVHPTHSVCGVGARAAELLGDHHLDTTPVGPRSAFRRLRDCAGKVVMFGCGLQPNTSMHGVEELVQPPYLFAGTTTFKLIHADGVETTMDCRRHDFAGWEQRYDRLGPLLADEGMTTGKVLGATVHVLESRLIWERGLEALQRDALFFVVPLQGRT
jgi:aminoglycoside 3-N-acetyltransferase